jgi:hypothetical protein
MVNWGRPDTEQLKGIIMIQFGVRLSDEEAEKEIER